MILALALLLTGCGAGETAPEEAALALREAYHSLTSFQAQAQVVADYGQRAYQYMVACDGNATEGSLTVLEPESIAGAGTRWADGETVLDYEELTLETGQLSPDGLSPADALPVLLNACGSAELLESGWTDWGEEGQSLYLLLQNPEEQESTIALWADPETFALRQAELYWEAERIISFTFTDFTYETAGTAEQ